MGFGEIFREGQEVYRRADWLMKQSVNMNPVGETTMEGEFQV